VVAEPAVRALRQRPRAAGVIVDLTQQAVEALAYVLRDEEVKRDALCLEYPDVDYFPASG
jgi:hypothetical protein